MDVVRRGPPDQGQLEEEHQEAEAEEAPAQARLPRAFRHWFVGDISRLVNHAGVPRV